MAKSPADKATAATNAMKVTDLEKLLKTANTDKETVAKEAQALRVQLGEKVNHAKTLSKEREELAILYANATGRIAELGKMIAEIEAPDPAAGPKPTADRPETGKYAAVIFGSLLQAHRLPQTILTEGTALDAVKGAKMICAVLDREFPSEES